jgi:fatty acid desaturase
VAWPTLAVFVAAVATWLLGVVLGTRGLVAPAAAIAACALGAYAAFTPLHEASHRSIARARWVSELVGRASGVLLIAPFPAFVRFHLEHHKHTNDPVADPDHWSGRGPAWALPLRWLTQDLHYYVRYARSLRSRPARERAEVLGTIVALAGAASALAAPGHAREVLLFWVLPARLAIGFLAFAFDWLPHRPHVVTAKEDRYRATGAFESRIAFALLFGQNLHLVHHLYPGVPFYRYGSVWRAAVHGPARRPPRAGRRRASMGGLDDGRPGSPGPRW